MITALFLLVATASPNAEDFLLARAGEALAKGDRAKATELLRGWASLGPRGGLPAKMEKEAAEAMLWAEGQGHLRIYASRLEDRVRVGVFDPAGLVAHIEAFAIVGGETIRIARAENEANDRLEFRISTQEAPVVVAAVMTKYGAEVPLAQIELAPVEKHALPARPDPEAMKKKLARPEAPPKAAEEIVPWWLIVAGVAAAGLAGAAIWQETRF